MLALFSWFRRRPETTAQPAHEARALESFPWTVFAPTAAGISVGPESALASPTFLAVTRVLSEAIGTLPVHLFRRGSNGAREREVDHPAARLMAGDWAPWAGNVAVRTALAVDALLHGQAFAQVIRAGGQPREIHRLPPGSVTVDYDTATLEPAYKVRLSGGGERRLGWRDCIHVAMPGAAAGRKLSLVDLCRESIALELAIDRYASRLFSAGGRPSGLLTLPKGMPPERMEAARDVWLAAHGGGEAGKVAVMPEGTTFEPLQLSSVDMQTLEIKRLAIQQIAGAAKVPLTLIGSLDRAVWRNVQELNTQFVQQGLLPHLEIWKSALERVLLSTDERAALYLEFQVDDLMRGDLPSRFAAYRTASGSSWMTANEIRAREDMPPIDGGDALVRQAGQSVGDAPRNSAESNDANDLPEDSADE
jgi:HK97 family phage portal protein